MLNNLSHFSFERNVEIVDAKTRRFSVMMGQSWRKILCLTYPHLAWTTGSIFNNSLKSLVGGEFDISVRTFCTGLRSFSEWLFTSVIFKL
jgi:hypothetical protein